MEPEELELLKNEFGRHKEIPEKYEEVILTALSHYPELKETRITFCLTNNHPVPYGTAPSFRSILAHPYDREYIITLLEDAKAPMFYALFKNLTTEAQLGVLAHEIAHVVQYNSLNRSELIKFLACYMLPAFQQKIEQAADMGAIIHGFGKELLEHAIYIRCIPGYVEERKEININYLHPSEILEYLPE
ncbi:MAG TPA: M48 family metalloprotease [Bacteroidia bacterium]|jgi:hypothetical protein